MAKTTPDITIRVNAERVKLVDKAVKEMVERSLQRTMERFAEAAANAGTSALKTGRLFASINDNKPTLLGEVDSMRIQRLIPTFTDEAVPENVIIGPGMIIKLEGQQQHSAPTVKRRRIRLEPK